MYMFICVYMYIFIHVSQKAFAYVACRIQFGPEHGDGRQEDAGPQEPRQGIMQEARTSRRRTGCTFKRREQQFGYRPGPGMPEWTLIMQRTTNQVAGTRKVVDEALAMPIETQAQVRSVKKEIVGMKHDQSSERDQHFYY